MSRGALAAATGFYVAWFLSSVISTPLLWYLPLERRFVFASVVTELGMDFYGRLLLALVAAALAAGLTRVVKPPLRTLSVWALSTFALCVVLEVTVLAHRVPTPLPKPVERQP
jgi:hypothetical protein